jgi:hypothetical protein
MTDGDCLICGGRFTKRTMTRHLQKCLPAAWQPAPRAKPRDAFHLIVEALYDKEYWLHLVAGADAALADLDGFLRALWLECCGHLSAFTIGDLTYSDPMFELGDASDQVKLGRVLTKGLEFRHDYDFGSTTTLKLRVAGPLQLPLGTHEVRLAARNLAPERLCECGEPAVMVCSYCAWDAEGWLCAECAAEHECGDEALLPVVNSPRCGVCAYGMTDDE